MGQPADFVNLDAMQMEEARGFVFQALRESGWNQYGQILESVGLISARARSIAVNPLQLQMGGAGRQLLNDREKSLIMEVVWSLIIQGILIPGMNDSNQSWPFLRLTEYGRKGIEEDRILPHDPDGFLRDFHREVPSADSTVVEYLTEALQCYIHGLPRSAAVMLGGASEQAVLLLIESCANSIAEARAGSTNFADVDLSVAKGLGTIEHDVRSTIGIDTIFRSRGKIPEAYLRGCGVPDEFIVYVRSLAGRRLKFSSCFISYSTRDHKVAKRLYADLQALGVRCWLASEDLKIGEKFQEKIEESIRVHDKLLLVLSKNSVLRLARRYFRSSVFCIAGSIEAFVNYIADSFDKAKSIPEHEICFLNDRAVIFSAAKGVHARNEYHRLIEPTGF